VALGRGARAKAIIAWNRRRTRCVPAGEGPARVWLLAAQVRWVSANKDKELEDPKGYTLIEYAYALMPRMRAST